MRKAFIAIACFFAPAFVQAGLFSSGGSPDYSNNAGNTFYCSNLTGSPVTTQAGLSATAPALVLTNPSTSQKKLVLLDIGINIAAAPAAASGFVLAYSTGAPAAIVYYATNTVVIPELVPNVIMSSTTQTALSSGQCYGGPGTVLPNTPVGFRYLGGTTGAAAISGVLLTDMTQGKVVVPPGSTVSLQTKTAASVSAHFVWREDPL